MSVCAYVRACVRACVRVLINLPNKSDARYIRNMRFLRAITKLVVA